MRNEHNMIKINSSVEQSVLLIMQRHKENFTFVTNVSGNLDTFIELMWILLMELEKVVLQSICIQRTVWNISYTGWGISPLPPFVNRKA